MSILELIMKRSDCLFMMTKSDCHDDKVRLWNNIVMTKADSSDQRMSRWHNGSSKVIMTNRLSGVRWRQRERIVCAQWGIISSTTLASQWGLNTNTIHEICTLNQSLETQMQPGKPIHAWQNILLVPVLQILGVAGAGWVKTDDGTASSGSHAMRRWGTRKPHRPAEMLYDRSCNAQLQRKSSPERLEGSDFRHKISVWLYQPRVISMKRFCG